MKGTGRAALATVIVALAGGALGGQVSPAAQGAASAAGITTPVLAACEGQFRQGQRGWAVATNNRYVVIDGLGPASDLAPFTGAPDLACYSRAEALDLHRTIQRSETISGRIAPPFATSVVCGFIDPTTAKCWQYSPLTRVYLEVGGWST